MRARDLALRDFLGTDQTLLIDRVAFGLLRKELIERLGLSVTRGVLTRFGYALGRRMAEGLESAFDWESGREWERAGERWLTLTGWIAVQSIVPDLAQDLTAPYTPIPWMRSYEAEAHLRERGRASEPVCWTLVGFASGYSSVCQGREIVLIESECLAKGDPRCAVVESSREESGDVFACRGDSSRSSAAGPSTDSRHSPPGFVAESRAMRRALDIAARVARVDTTAVLIGERGVGKERIARILHERSYRRDAPFVPVSCGALPESLLESELFGHRAGAFQGAVADRAGLFEAADGGTLFLNEILELSPALQLKLLRTLDTGRVWRMGETEERPVNVRVLAGTDREIGTDVASGRFRPELFHRLRVVELRIPPLRERREDVLPLAQMVLIDSARRLDRAVPGFSSEAAEKLVRYDWPGNAGELSTAIERAVVVASGPRVEPFDLPEEIRDAPPRAVISGESRTLAEVEREHILATLRGVGGNKTQAAERLGIGTATLFRKLAKYQKHTRRR